MLEKLKEKVCEANKLLVKYGLVTFTWGNVSGIDRKSGYMAIKPSGVEYDKLTPQDIVIVDINTGEKVEGDLSPSSDTPTHCEIYRSFSSIGGITHTHSRWATIFSQARRGIPVLGTTHADYFYGEIPCTRKMTRKEIMGSYEKETGRLIVETFGRGSEIATPGVLVYNHGPFTWGENPKASVHNAVILEEIAFMAWHNLSMEPGISPMQQDLMDKHYFRKHGENAYYGQRRG
jgi:Ribulose-5-phosphate 4-epimerase and related epimerases and aldolases